jgi:hypothetical protein
MVNLVLIVRTSQKATVVSGVAGLPCRNAPVFS